MSFKRLHYDLALKQEVIVYAERLELEQQDVIWYYWSKYLFRSNEWNSFFKKAKFFLGSKKGKLSLSKSLEIVMFCD